MCHPLLLTALLCKPMENCLAMIPENNKLTEIADLGKDFVDTHKEIEFLEGRLADVKKKYNRLSTELLPYAMQSVGMTSFEIGNRYTIKTEPVLVVKADKE